MTPGRLLGSLVEIPIPSPRSLICVGGTIPERNEEYKRRPGRAVRTPRSSSRFPRSFIGHDGTADPPARSSPQLDC